MFNREPREKTGLEKAIDDLLSELAGPSADSPEYEKMVDQLAKLHAMKTNDGRKRINPDTWATIIANLGGILIMVGYEQKHLITSKALPFIRKFG